MRLSKNKKHLSKGNKHLSKDNKPLSRDNSRRVQDNERLIGENEKLAQRVARLSQHLPPPAFAPPAPSVSLDDAPEPSLAAQIINELIQLSSTAANGQSFSDSMIDLPEALSAISPRASRVLREVFPFQSPRTLFSDLTPEKLVIGKALADSPDMNPLIGYLFDYRAREGLLPETIGCTLAFDAAAVTATGLRAHPGKTASTFTFLLLPLDHRYPDLPLRSVPRIHGKINGDILKIKDQLLVGLMAAGFIPYFVATDGVGAVNPAYMRVFE
jgi:hypothetical protein